MLRETLARSRETLGCTIFVLFFLGLMGCICDSYEDFWVLFWSVLVVLGFFGFWEV